MAQDYPNGIDLNSTGRVSHSLDPAVSTDGATKNYVDTTTSALHHNSHPFDEDIWGDLASTFGRELVMAGSNWITLGTVNQQWAFFGYCQRPASSTGIKFFTGSGSAGGSSATVTVSLYTGTSAAAMTKQGTWTAPFTAAAFTEVDVPYGSSITIPTGLVAYVFTCTAVGTAPGGRLMAPLALSSSVAGGGLPGGTFLNPVASRPWSLFRTSSTSLPTTMDFTTGWSANTVPAWMTAY